MAGAKLPEYRGPLTPKGAADGINAAIKNAARLAADARLLLEAGRNPTAAAIAALSIEESGKVSLLRGLVVQATPEGLRDQWRRYRDHRSKNGMWILPALAAQGARSLLDFAATVDRDAEHTAMLNTVKQLGLYTDCYGEANWSEPDAVVERELAERLVSAAELLSSNRPVTVREMELWVENVGPATGSELPAALVRWAALMHEEGLSETSAEAFAQFLQDGQPAPD